MPLFHHQLFAAFVAFAAVCAATPPGLFAQSADDEFWEMREQVDDDEFNYNESLEKPWIETEVEIPPPTAVEDMRRLQLDSLQNGFTLYVDMDSIHIDPGDRVVRMWLWIRSDAGHESGTFEGYRCGGRREYKVFAYANPKRKPVVRVAKAPRWKKVSRTRQGNYRHDLAWDYVCGASGNRSVDDIRRAMAGVYESPVFVPQ